MRKPASMKAPETLGRVCLSPNLFMCDMLYSEIANSHRIQNTPDDPDPAIATGRRLCMDNHAGDHSAMYPGFPELRLA